MTGIELLVALRELKIQQQAFAKRIGVHPSVVSRYINGWAEIPAPVIAAVRDLQEGAQ